MFLLRYKHEHQTEWDEFAAKAKNAHFFFQRDYMEYHKDRFEDYSLMVYDDKERLVALLPATKKENELISHGGLTFGGFLVDERMGVAQMLAVFGCIMDFLRERGFHIWTYKCIPYIYHRYPAEEDGYALFRYGAELVRRDASAAIYLPTRYKYQKGRKWMIAKGKKNGITVRKSKDYEKFIAMENDVLLEHHEAKAVHSGEELRMLADRFPDNIKLYVGERDGEMLAGTVIFENGQTVHTQYLANSEEGRKCGALDVVIDHLLNEVYTDRTYFDFGISNEDNGRYLNEGLIAQKEGFGARAVVHDFYKIVL